jgi:flagellar hook-associated protein 1 FlgK
MFNLQNNLSIDGKTFNEFYTGIITTIGSKVSESNYLTDAQSLVLNKLEIDRMSVSGVSLDEEMTHMIQYEQAYNAAAKLVSTVDEMIASILNIV